MEEALHRYVLGPWSADHAGRPGAAIQQLEYDRERYPEQRIETYLTPINKLPPSYLLPDRLLRIIIRSKLAGSLGSKETASHMIDSFRDRPTSKTDSTPLLDKLSSLFDSGETVSLLDTHADFTGGLKLLAAISTALGKRRYFELNHAIISKTMAREKIYGKPVGKVATPVASVVWVIPDTDSYERLVANHGLDEPDARLVKAAAEKVNAGAMRELAQARKQGGFLQWAPFSSAVVPEHDSNNRLVKLKAPSVPAQVPGLLARSRYALTAGYWQDPGSGAVKWSVGDLIDRDSIDVKPRRVRDGVYLERAIGDLCTILADLSGVPVEYSSKVFETSSHHVDTSRP